ncbi:OX-2 membrane glycoprotein-like [Parambassis ranga]|uniref:OX-2 membrane glycoprotein-like n=1 Tax=Parambassis ranga TaxID=210632 RepID=A0A6P7I019_9TELE|nr:OX-2 membrane glycoprotein-like [Parambassis ranga]
MKKMLQSLFIICLLLKVSLSQLSGHGPETVMYGKDAEFRCVLENPAGVQQVTWQRLFQDNFLENLATYSKRFGQQVNEPYRGKVLFTEESLNSTSITLKNVTWEDESCYICAFNVYPDGSKRKQMCLTVKGISNVTSGHVISSGHEKHHREVVFSCSATGRPAPTIDWDYSTGATLIDEAPTAADKHRDHTVTSSRNITLRVPSDWTGHVDCLLNSGTDRRRQERIHLPLHEGKGQSTAWVASVIIISIIFVSCIFGVAVWKRLKENTRFSKTASDPV